MTTPIEVSKKKSRKDCITGTREEVWAGTKKQTKGGLEKKDLQMNGKGAIVSAKKSAAGKERMSTLVKKKKEVSVPAPKKEPKPKTPRKPKKVEIPVPENESPASVKAEFSASDEDRMRTIFKAFSE